MDVRTPAWIWFLRFLILEIIKPASSVSLNHEQNQPTKHVRSAIPTEALIFLESVKPIEKTNVNESKATRRSRFYRQVESEDTPSIEPVATTVSSDDLKINDLSEKNDTPSTTESVDSITESDDSNKTVVPLPSTETYNFLESPELIDTNKTETTNQYHEPSDLSKNDATVEVTDLPKDDKDYDYLDSTSNSNLIRTEESVTPSNPGLNPIEKTKSAEESKQLEVVGFSEAEKHNERIMILQPSKEEKYVFLKETVHNMVEDTMLKRETEDYVLQLNRRYEDLPLVEGDNSIWRKYSRAVAERFVLDFLINYPHYTASEQWIARWYKEEEYNRMYNATLQRLQEKRDYTAVQFAAGVRRAADIYKAILDTPIGIVQSKCKAHMPQWLCFAEYVVNLADKAESCEYVWYHAQVHLTVLQTIRQSKGAKEPATEIIDELNSRLSLLEQNNDVEHLFDFIIQTLGDLGKRLKDSLLSRVSVYSLIRNLQSEDKLKCLAIDQRL